MTSDERLEELSDLHGSLDDEDQDEDFVASESESDDNDDDDSENEFSEDDQGKTPDSDHSNPDQFSPGIPLDFLKHALDGEKVLDEPTISASDISKEFPEEEDDVRAVLLGSDVDDAEEEGEANSAATGSEASFENARRAAPSMTAAQSAAPPTTTPFRITDAAGEVDGLPSPAIMPLSPSMEMMDAMLPSLKGTAAMPIAQRTRAHVSLMDISIEQLEAALSPAIHNEPFLFYGVDDEAEYQRFLASLQQQELRSGNFAHGDNQDGAEGVGRMDIDVDEEDSDDEDFLHELERMLEEEEELKFDVLGRRRRGSKRGRRRLLFSSNNQTNNEQPRRRSERLKDKNSQRPLFLNSLLDKRSQAIHNHALDKLATLASNMVGPPIPLPSDIFNRDNKDHVASAAENVVWQAPLPKTMRQYDISIAASAPDETAPIIAGHFQTSQYTELYSLFHQHVQLLEQTVIMAVATKDIETASIGTKLLQQLGDFVTLQTVMRKSNGIPPYVSSCLGIDTGEGAPPARPDVLNTLSTRKQHKNGSLSSWTIQNPGDVYTVADVAVLRAAPRMLEHLPATALGRQNSSMTSIEEEGGLEGRNDQQQQRQNSNDAPRIHHVQVENPSVKKNRRRQKPKNHEIWDNLPDDVALALRPVKPFFDPGLEPTVPDFFVSKQLLFTPAEDTLLAWGIRKHLYDWDKISVDLLPTKPGRVLFNRKKNRTRSNLENDENNVIKRVVGLITGELTQAEEVLIINAMKFYGRQPGKWDIICKEHLPHRHPPVLSMIWSAKMKKWEEEASQKRTTVEALQAAVLARAQLSSPDERQQWDILAASLGLNLRDASSPDAAIEPVEGPPMSSTPDFLAVNNGSREGHNETLNPNHPLPSLVEWTHTPVDNMNEVGKRTQREVAGTGNARNQPPVLVEKEREHHLAFGNNRQHQQQEQTKPNSGWHMMMENLESPPHARNGTRDSKYSAGEEEEEEEDTHRKRKRLDAEEGVIVADEAQWSQEEKAKILRTLLPLKNASFELQQVKISELATQLGRSEADVRSIKDILLERVGEQARQRKRLKKQPVVSPSGCE